MFVILCNAPVHEAKRLAFTLVEEGLAACDNLFPAVTSIYVWEGAVQEEQESTLLIKTSAEAVDALGERIRALHSYDTVEILALPVDAAHSDPRYVSWVHSAVKTGRADA